MTPSQRRVQILLERLPPTPHERDLALRSDPDVIALVVELLVSAAYWFNATVDPHPSPFAKAAMLYRHFVRYAARDR